MSAVATAWKIEYALMLSLAHLPTVVPLDRAAFQSLTTALIGP
jgi:hypothetical protein